MRMVDVGMVDWFDVLRLASLLLGSNLFQQLSQFTFYFFVEPSVKHIYHIPIPLQHTQNRKTITKWPHTQSIKCGKIATLQTQHPTKSFPSQTILQGEL